MKILVLLPVKNEAWILPYTLDNFSQFSDLIIIADQKSTDGSREIYKRFPKVRMIENKLQEHSHAVRRLLLSEARKVPGEKLIICLDADELLSPKAIDEMVAFRKAAPISFTTRWIQLAEYGTKQRVDGIWRDHDKAFAFFDDGIAEYHNTVPFLDHTNRIPDIAKNIRINKPILHLQFMPLQRNRIKQIWYMCIERMHGVHPIRINARYAVNDERTTVLSDIDQDWLWGVALPPMHVFNTADEFRAKEVHSFFDHRGIAFFEPLAIWDIDEFLDRFKKETGRYPRPLVIPRTLLEINRIRNKVFRTLRQKLRKPYCQ
jgi:glycosyltransferase involved in cell wall biosynthesis